MGILVVEDDEAVRGYITDLLIDEGYPVEAAEHGQDALARLASGPWLPDLILLDLMMPVMTGWQLAQVLCRHPLYSTIPVVIMSAAGKLGDELRELPIVDILPKPIQAERLLRVIAFYCGSPEAAQARAAQGSRG
jgi:CheY-like chemotaxis protein